MAASKRPRCSSTCGTRKITSFFHSEASQALSSTDSDPSEDESAPQPARKQSNAKHRSKFDPSWKEQFSWLLFVPDDDDGNGPAMYCELCQKHNTSVRNTVWVNIPCRLFRRDKIRDHEASQRHTDSLVTESHAVAAKRSGGIRAAIEKQVSLKRQAVLGALKCLYWLAKEESAHHTKFESLLELGKSLGCTYLSELDNGKNAHYTSHRIIDEFLSALSSCVEDDLLSKIRSSPVISILCDESTDVSNLKQLVVFCRFLAAGKPQTCFLKVTDIVDGKAETIEQKLIEICTQCGITTNKIFGFGSDGASVMTGRHSGVAARLKKHNPEMVSIHCGAHRLALACSQACLEVPYMKKYDSHLVSLFYYFANSSVREASLHLIQEVMGEPSLKLKKAVHTRWLSHEAAVTAIRRTLSSLIATLESEIAVKDDAIAHGLLHAVKSYNFVATTYLLSDILPHLTSLSLLFQKEDVDLSVIQPQVTATISVLKSLRCTPGPCLQRLDEAITKLATEFNLSVTEGMKQAFQKNVREKYLDALVDNLENRFSDSGVLRAFASIFSAEKAIKVQSDCFNSYGDSEVEILSTQFTHTVVKERLQQEWSCFKHILVSDFKEQSTKNLMLIVSEDTSFSSLYPSLSYLASIALILPLSTADCERGFSTLKRIKTDARNRLKTDTLDKLIRLSSEGPSMSEFNFDRAATLWSSRSNRRIKI